MRETNELLHAIHPGTLNSAETETGHTSSLGPPQQGFMSNSHQPTPCIQREPGVKDLALLLCLFIAFTIERRLLVLQTQVNNSLFKEKHGIRKTQWVGYQLNREEQRQEFGSEQCC